MPLPWCPQIRSSLKQLIDPLLPIRWGHHGGCFGRCRPISAPSRATEPCSFLRTVWACLGKIWCSDDPSNTAKSQPERNTHFGQDEELDLSDRCTYEGHHECKHQGWMRHDPTQLITNSNQDSHSAPDLQFFGFGFFFEFWQPCVFFQSHHKIS